MRFLSVIIRFALAAVFVALSATKARACTVSDDVIAMADSAITAIIERRSDDCEKWIDYIAHAEECPDAGAIASSLKACLDASNGKYDVAMHDVDEVIRRYASASDTVSINCLALAYCAKGMLEHETKSVPSDSYYKKAERLARNVGNLRVEMISLCCRAEMYISVQRFVEAGFCARMIIARSTNYHSQDMRFWARQILLKLYLGLHVRAAIEDCIRDIEREGYYRDRPFLEMAYREVIAIAKLCNGDNVGGLESIKYVDDLANEHNVSIVDKWRIRVVMAEALQRLGRYDEARRAVNFCRANIGVIPPENVNPYYSRFSLSLVEAAIAIGEDRPDDALAILDNKDIPDIMFTKMSFSTRYFSALERAHVKRGDYEAAHKALAAGIVNRNNILAVNARTRAKDMEIAFRDDTTILRQRVDINASKVNYSHVQQQVVIITLVVFLVLAIVAAIWMRRVWNRNASKIKEDEDMNQKMAEEIERQTFAYQNRNRLIMRRNADIAASQSYARRLQRGILPDVMKLKANGFKDTFVVRGSADTTSGCFFWFRKLSDAETILCVANADWNGIPGAMLSMVGLTLVEEVSLRYDGKESASEFIAEVENRFVRRLPDRRWRSNLSMSIAIVNTQSRRVRLASAGSDILIRLGSSFEVIRGSDKKIGVLKDVRRQQDEVKVFQPGDALFMFSSNMTSIKGGNDNRLLGNDGLTDMLSRVSRLPASLQYDTMLNELLLWKSGMPLNDDILLLSVTMQ